MYLDLGLKYYRAGYFSKTFGAFRRAWELGKDATEWHPRLLVDRAFGELVKMHARVGHAAELEALFAELGMRPISGSASELVTGAREGLTEMRLRPGHAFLCGPAALASVLRQRGGTREAAAPVLAAESGPQGFTLRQVGDLADQAGLSHRLIYRSPGQTVPVPSVIHWNVNHYAAIVRREGDRYVVLDPTFAERGGLVLSQAAIDAEASGFFLAPADVPQDAGWRDATPEEAEHVHGMGMAVSNYPGAITPVNPRSHHPSRRRPTEPVPLENPMGEGGCKAHPGTPRTAMCEPDVHVMEASLNLNDTPVGYAPQMGPPVFARLTYNQRESAQPSTFYYFNVGQKWTINALAYIVDDPTSPGSSVSRYYAGGGYYADPFSYNPTTGAFFPDQNTGGRLVRTPATGALSYYTLTNPDGSTFKYAQVDGSTAYPRRVFITNITDPQGHGLTFNYGTVTSSSCPVSSCTVLQSIADAEDNPSGTRRLTTFCYDPTRASCSTYSGTSLRISRITDPFGRHADIDYDASGRLSKITDVIGITSTMGYDGSGFVNSLTTPYGTTNFAFGETFDPSGNVQSRYVETTDPDSHTERLEFYQAAPGIAAFDTAIPGGFPLFNNNLHFRDAYFWDKSAYPTYGTGMGRDFTKARQWHFTHEAWSWLNIYTSPMVGSTKEPLESRVWYTSYGQANGTDYDGALYAVTGSAQLTGSGSEIETSTRNGYGHLLSATDPLGRFWRHTYASSGSGQDIDLVKVEQKTSTTTGCTATTSTVCTQLAAYGSYRDHQPGTYTDASGQTWTYTYDSTTKKLATVTDPLGNVTTYHYEAGLPYRLTSITDALGNAYVSYGYSSTCSSGGGTNCDLPQTVTFPDGATATYARDALDRVLSSTDNAGRVETYNYTASGGTHRDLDLQSYTDKAGHTTNYAYDAERRVASVTDPLLHTVRYGYYPNGALHTLTDENGHVTTWGIDLQSRPTSKTYADSTAETYAYDSTTSRLHSATDALSQVKTYSYDLAGELTGITYTGAVNTTPNVTFAWDTYFPRRTQMTDGLGATTWSYVAPGTCNTSTGASCGALQLSMEDGPYSNDTAVYVYDADGRVSGLTVGGTPQETFSYDAIGRVTTHYTPFGWFNYTNFIGETPRWVYRTLSNSPVAQGAAFDSSALIYRTYTSGATARQYTITNPTLPGGQKDPYLISRIAEDVASGSTHPWAASLRDWDFGYDAADRLLTQKPHGAGTATWTWGYDNASNVTTIANPTASGSSYGQAYSAVNTPTTGFTFDGAGNRASDTPYTYKFDAENRVVEFKYAGAAGKTNYSYDGLGRRLQSAFYNGSTTVNTRFQWCGGSVCAKRDGSDTVLKRYYPEGEWTVSGWVQWIYVRDPSGNVRDIVDKSGNLVGSIDYTAYGYPTRTYGTLPDFRFGEMYTDPNMGQMLSATRMYDPWDAQWISRDPISERGGINLYQYAGGNPVTKMDASGLCPEDGYKSKPLPGEDGPGWVAGVTWCTGLFCFGGTIDEAGGGFINFGWGKPGFSVGWTKTDNMWNYATGSTVQAGTGRFTAGMNGDSVAGGVQLPWKPGFSNTYGIPVDDFWRKIFTFVDKLGGLFTD